MIDFSASHPWYCDHLAPLWKALPAEVRGSFWSDDPATIQRINAWEIGPLAGGNYRASKADVLVGAAWRDIAGAKRPRLVLTEHGAGQSYSTQHPAYANGDHPNLYRHLVPRPAMVTDAHPERVWIGNPRLDGMYPPIHHEPPDNPVIGFAYHWNCQISTESDTAFYEYRDQIKTAIINGYQVICTAHPRLYGEAAEWYEANQIPHTPSWQVVNESADILVCDSSSVLFEFAASGRPVIQVNKSTWRRDINHGLRFWDTRFTQVDHPAWVVGAIDIVHSEYETRAKACRAEAEQIFGPLDGKSTERAVSAILECLGKSV